jgi:phosphotransferase system HPr (HPr) family protein
VTIKNRLGLHARPAMAFVDTASQFASAVTVRRADQTGPDAEIVDGKSIMEMMLLAATMGTQLDVEAQGADARSCCAALVELVERGFDEE